MFESNGTIEKTYVTPPEAVGAAIAAVCQEQGHHLGSVSPDGSRYELNTKRTAHSWGVAMAMTLSPGASGTDVRVDYDNVPNSPKALLDGRKNAKTVKKFLTELDAKL
ncbi:MULTISPECIES: hypothetical protein [Dermacoccus]|uniref:Uncharacterized protein n=3 Tax=Dermacoccus TaxID=57495 RepID=A0A417ZBI3_9MICO|nr:hypothetical protein [Dermacoccus abyssi]RHW48007.1 hypothetical protein D1832_00760 [Dermacoccus abyssi]